MASCGAQLLFGDVAVLLTNFTFHKQLSLRHQHLVVRCLHLWFKCQCQMQTCSVGAERSRLEAEEQARKAAEEEKRQELIQLQTEREDARLANER